MEYRDINEVISSAGLRLVLLRGYPSPWGQAVKAMMEYKGLNYTKGALEAGGRASQPPGMASCTDAAEAVPLQSEPTQGL